MDLYHLSSPQNIEATRLFHLIQQTSPNPKPVLNAESLLSFLNKLGLKNDEVIKFLHRIDQEGKEMNQDYWEICISRHFSKLDLKCVGDLHQFHSSFKGRVAHASVEPLARF